VKNAILPGESFPIVAFTWIPRHENGGRSQADSVAPPSSTGRCKKTTAMRGTGLRAPQGRTAGGGQGEVPKIKN